jgi:hypothetical protein
LIEAVRPCARVARPACSNLCDCLVADESKPLKKGPKPAPKPLKQTKLNPKLALAELDMDAPAVFANPVAPELTVENAATRFILVPAAQFQAVGIGGWIARCAAARPRAGPPMRRTAHAAARTTPCIISDSLHFPCSTGSSRSRRTGSKRQQSNSRTRTASIRPSASSSCTSRSRSSRSLRATRLSLSQLSSLTSALSPQLCSDISSALRAAAAPSGCITGEGRAPAAPVCTGPRDLIVRL